MSETTPLPTPPKDDDTSKTDGHGKPSATKPVATPDGHGKPS
jgi:hypothetical protein